MTNTWVSDYVGIPYELHRQDHRACDCYGLLHLVYREVFNIVLPTYFGEYNSVSSNSDIENIYRSKKNYWIEVPKGQEREGDVAYFRIAGFEMHVGIVVKNNRFLHTIDKNGSSMLSDYTNFKWRNRLIGFWRHE